MPAKPILICSAFLAPVLMPSPAWAEEDAFTLSGSSRLRFEAIDGQPRAGFDKQDSLVNLRTQVMAQFKTDPVEIVAELYDSRIWGEDDGTPVTTGEVNAFELVQAYVGLDLGKAFGRGTGAKIRAGRFTLNLGSRRLVAADDYRNTTNGYTGARADLSFNGGAKVVLIYVLPQVRLPEDPVSLRNAKVESDRESFDQVLWGGLLSKPLVGSGSSPVLVEGGFFHLGERDGSGRATRDRSLNTATARTIAEPRPSKFDFEIEGMYQWGSISASLDPAANSLPVSASFVHAEAGYTFAGKWKPRLSFEFDRASGDRNGKSYGRFDTLFGMRRADLAPAGLYNAIGRANIVTPGLRLEVTPSARIDGFLSYRPMWLASRTDSFSTTGVRDLTGHSGSFAGHQVDARLRYWLQPEWLRFELDGVLLAKGHFLTDAPNAPPGKITSYLSLNLTASF